MLDAHLAHLLAHDVFIAIVQPDERLLLPATGEFEQPVVHRFFAGIDAVRRARAEGEGQFCIVQIDGDGLGTAKP